MADKFEHLNGIHNVQVLKSQNRVILRIRIPKHYRQYFLSQYEVTPYLHHLMSAAEASNWQQKIKSAMQDQIRAIDIQIANDSPVQVGRFHCLELDALQQRVDELKIRAKSMAAGANAETSQPLTEIDVKRAEKQWVSEFLKNFIEKVEQLSLESENELNELLNELEAQKLATNLSRLRKNINYVQSQVQSYLECKNLTASPDSELYRALCSTILTKQVEAIQQAQDYLQGRNVDQVELAARSHIFVTMADAFEVWVNTSKATQKSKAEAKKSLALFNAFCTEKFKKPLYLEEITTPTIMAFKDWLKFGEKECERPSSERALATIKKHFGLLNAVLNQYIAFKGLNPAQYVSFTWKLDKEHRVVSSIQTQLRQMTKAEAKALCSSEVRENLRSSGLNTDLALADALELLPATGMRLGELTRLSGAEIQVYDEYLVLQALNIPAELDGSGFERRTKSGKNREIVLKRNLISTYLFERLKNLAGNCDAHVLPGLKFTSDGRRGRALSRAFERVAQRLGVKRTGLCLHGFRHLHIKYARACGVSENILNSQVGHSATHKFGYGGEVSIAEIVNGYACFEPDFECLPVVNSYVLKAA
jgi:integrase